MDLNNFSVPNEVLVASTVVIFTSLLFASCLTCCSGSNNVATAKAEEDFDTVDNDTDQEEVNIVERNSKLAFMLILLLLENKSANRKYIRMAEKIGYDHIINEGDLQPSDEDEVSDKE